MNGAADAAADRGFCLPVLAAAVVDGAGTVTRWSAEAARMLERPAEDVCGRPFRELVADSAAEEAANGVPGDGGVPASGRFTLRKGSRDSVDVSVWVTGLEGAAAERLILLAPFESAVEWGQGVSMLRAVFDQDVLGLAVQRTDLRLERTNITPEMFGGPPLGPGSRIRDVLREEDAAEVEAVLGQVLASGVPVLSRHLRMRSLETPPQEWTLSLSAFRMEDAWGRPSGVASVLHDVTSRERIRRHRELLHKSATEIGFSLDVRRTARALAEVVGDIADLVTVDLTRAVLVGDEPPVAFGGGETGLVRVAGESRTGRWPSGLLGVGEAYPVLPDSPELRQIQRGRPVVFSRKDVIGSLGGGALAQRLVPEGAHWLTVSPLFSRGRMLGTLTAWRNDRFGGAFERDEVELLSEIASRAALGIDNARRYTREHMAAVALQQRLLPRAVTDTPAVHTAGVYQPAGGGAGVGGDWFDVIPLPSLRVALVVGDVIGHGLPAAAAMARIRTAVQSFAALELEPAEVLAHVEDLVQRLAAEAPAERRDAVGATCLYAVYDPTSCRCSIASAGQPPPVLVSPDGAVTTLDISPGPPLGVGGVPYESKIVDVPPGSVLALCTDGLLKLRPYAGADGLSLMGQKVARLRGENKDLEEIGEELMTSARGASPRDDAAVLLAQTAAVSSQNIASWEFPADAESVADARSAAAAQLTRWGMEDLAFSTELVVSELVTNAVRYAGGPVVLRLIRDEVLICEVADPSNTQPRLIRADSTDEGGRGLFIVAQCTTRWGCRYGQRGKTIWTEQPIPAAPAAPAADEQPAPRTAPV
jgi:serine phosphatase RsbU (regulator of sigma subunit)/anti-sigma regulatory factor (Ser/Thr protein kinase)/PAS domain-containing protein